MINKRNVWITLVFIILDLVCIKGLMIDIKDARFILGLAMCLFLTVAFARRIKIKPAKTTQEPAISKDQMQQDETPAKEASEETTSQASKAEDESAHNATPKADAKDE